MKKELWEQVKSMPIEEVRQEVEDWVVDPGTTARRESAHNRMIMLYYIIMNLVMHSMLNL